MGGPKRASALVFFVLYFNPGSNCKMLLHSPSFRMLSMKENSPNLSNSSNNNNESLVAASLASFAPTKASHH
jgi:hypothetical protein